jgi:phosphatidylglycerol:prolipoprotein diacylglycerol transferase
VAALLFRIGPVPIHAFGAMMALGFFAAALVMQRDFARKGERLHLAAHVWEIFTRDPAAFLLSESELVWYGGLLGGTVATVWPIRRWGVDWASAADSAGLGLSLGLAIGRIGCHLAGDGD